MRQAQTVKNRALVLTRSFTVSPHAADVRSA